MKNVKILNDYIEKKGLSRIEFTQMCDLSQATIYNILRNGIMRIDTARKIEFGTRKELKVTDFDIVYPGVKTENKNEHAKRHRIRDLIFKKFK